MQMGVKKPECTDTHTLQMHAHADMHQKHFQSLFFFLSSFFGFTVLEDHQCALWGSGAVVGPLQRPMWL